MTDPPPARTAVLDQVEAALRDITNSYRNTQRPLWNATRTTVRNGSVFWRWALFEFGTRQQRRTAERTRWRDRPTWLAGRLAALTAYTAFALAYFDLNTRGSRADIGTAITVAAGWLLAHHLLRTAAARHSVALRWVRLTGRTWPLAAVLTAVVEARLWPDGFLAGVLGT
ncbi:hypothetical protein AB0K51_19180 [Kitasatospora sp. NPDC049285]|uniref:hypothetical protein n=1 Tax=Kitasatospora sp. NPDC049285 TaxID=3157096 RepID=UPI00341673CA